MEIADLLNYSALQHIPSSSLFPNKPDSTTSTITCTVEGVEFVCNLYNDNTLAITPRPVGGSNIRYAFVGIDSNWAGLPSQERGLGDDDVPLSSGISNIRARFYHLSTNSQVLRNTSTQIYHLLE